MDIETKKIKGLVVFLIVLGGVLPPALYWWVVARQPGVTPAEAKALLSREGSLAVLVDVRPEADFAAHHLDGARAWPVESILASRSQADVPADIRGKKILAICDSGILSGVAVGKLRELGEKDVANVLGGMQAWVGGAETPCALSFCRLRSASGEVSALPVRDAAPVEQWAAVISGFAIKPFYMGLSLILALVLIRSRSPDLVALRWALISFFLGEAFCALNYLGFGNTSHLVEYLHGLGMVIAFAFTAWAVLDGLDRRLVGFSDANGRCAAVPLCHGCPRRSGGPCGLVRTFEFMIPALAVLALLPAMGQPAAVSYNTKILGGFYNYSHAVVHQLYEIRFCPIAAAVLLALAFAALVWKRKEPVAWSKALFCAGIGALGFSYLRWVLFAGFREDLVWFETWEEITELIYILGVAFVLWTFRHGLFATARERAAGSPA